MPPRVVDWFRHHRLARSSLSALSGALMLVAVALLGYPYFTNLYQSRFEAGHLAQGLDNPALPAEIRQNQVPMGASLTRIQIPSIGVNAVVVQGTTESALRAGAGHYLGTPLPCTMGNVAIAGHRTTYGKPFANVDQLRPGDLIQLQTPVGACTYRVAEDPFVVLPTDVAVVANTPGEATLTLTSCTPKGFATHRIVVKATMVSGGLTS